MADIIIAFPKLDDAKALRKLLIKNGYDVSTICDSGSAVLEAVNNLDGGVIISGYRFSDMAFYELQNDLPKGFSLLLLASAAKLADSDLTDVVSLPMPFRVQDFLNTMEMMLAQYLRWQKKQKKKPKPRTEGEQQLIRAAKELLMERNNMTEEEAHHYLQKLSMDSATNIVEMAEMILDINGKEWEFE